MSFYSKILKEEQKKDHAGLAAFFNVKISLFPSPLIQFIILKITPKTAQE